MPESHPVRPATIADHAAIVEICLPMHCEHAGAEPRRFRAGATTLPADHVQRLLDDPDVDILVSEAEGVITGFLIVQIIASPDEDIIVPRRYAYIDTIAVDPGWQGHGVGRVLMAAAEDWARARGVEDLELNVAEFNTGAIRFYERLGFRPVWRRLAKDLKAEG